ncbi:MAG: tRNA epoxyqueuosine(34) reductase QueG [Terriglobales bacterium]
MRNAPHLGRELVLGAGREAGFDLVGIAGVQPSARMAMFPGWVESGQGGAMEYLARRGEDGHYVRERIQAAWGWARSVLCGGVVYNAKAPRSSEITGDRERGWISRYAWGDDYHEVLRKKLEMWIERLRTTMPPAPEGEQFRAVVDTAPLVERDAAWRAGLGWQGKNTCLIHPEKGSYFFLGSIVTSLELEEEAVLPDRCGSCTRCLEACPTEALTPYHMDASRCLAYMNIELRGRIPDEWRRAMGNNVVGCDICQDVCPWNRRAATTDEAAFQPRPGLLAPKLEDLGALDEAAYRERFRHSAVKRVKFSGLQRNTAIAMGNSGNPKFLPRLQTWMAGDDAELAEHAAWAVREIERGNDTAKANRIADHPGTGGGV